MTEFSALLGGSGGATREFEYVRGEYAISGERVPYFAISMTVNEAVSYLRLARDLAVNEEDPINLEELMQRDVTKLRAEEGIADYLRSPMRLKFFNSLTVVLMPIGQGGGPAMEFPSNEIEPVSPDGDGLLVTQAGPVKFRQLSGRTFGFLSWETSSTAAVVIDGQHRFLAMQRVRNETPQLLLPDITTLPVLLLVLDERVGFRPVHGGPQGIVKASRAIFTDINKYAVKVSPEREYLLDDLSITAVAMRAVMTQGIGGTKAESMDATPARIPLAIVDWIRPNQTKFDDGPYITSIQALHQLVAEVVQSPAPSGTAYDSLDAWVDRINSRMEVSGPAWNKGAIRQRLEAARETELPFSLTGDEVRAAADSFASGLGQVIVLVLLRATPYRQLIDAYLAAGLLGTRKELWLGQNSHARGVYEIQFNEHPAVDMEAAATATKSAYSLAYLVVFQRGFVVAGNEVAQIWTQLADEWELDDADRTRVVERWLAEFNTAVASTLGDHAFWAGTAVEPSGNINYAQVSKKAVMGLTLLLSIPGSATHDVRDQDGDAKLLQGDDADSDLELLAADPLRIRSPTPEQLLYVAVWRELLASIAPGPAAGGELGKLRRTAARAYREGLRRHIEQIALVRGRTLTEVQRDRLVLAHGARRLASALA